jgi:hypothetical protein
MISSLRFLFFPVFFVGMATSCYFSWCFLAVWNRNATEGPMVDREDETRSSPDFEEFELRPNLKDSEVCGVVG